MMDTLQYRSYGFLKPLEYEAPQRRTSRGAALCRGAAFIFVILTLSIIGFAQTLTTASANISFAFWAQGQEFAAGDYVFDNGYPGSATIRRKGSDSSTAIAVIPYGDPVKKEDAKLLFVSRDGKYYLAEIWCLQDRRVLSAEFARRGQVSEEQRQVSLTYP